VSEYVVESYFSGDPANVTPPVDELALAAQRMAGEGVQVWFVSATFLLEDEICFYLYEAASVDAVRDAVTRAHLDFERITQVVSRRPGDQARIGNVQVSSPTGAINEQESNR
jgi:hypothetical protein